MKKSKILVVGLIALLMAGGLIFAGCDKGCSYEGECYFNPNAYGSGSPSYSICRDSDCAANKAKNTTNSGVPTSGSCNCQ
jgi:hypothetical protein